MMAGGARSMATVFRAISPCTFGILAADTAMLFVDVRMDGKGSVGMEFDTC